MSRRGFRSLLAVLSAGFDSTGPVMGAVAMQILVPRGCRAIGPRLGRQPLVFPRYEEALTTAWAGAIARLTEEATRAGAHGVVGVTVRESKTTAATTAQQVMQLSLVGTGVRVHGDRAPLERPFVSMLSMEDTLKLLLRGWVPTGIGVGVSAIHVHGWAASPWSRSTPFRNMEMDTPTQGMALARERAEHSMRESLRAARAEGSVAATVRLKRSSQQCGNGKGLLLEGLLMATGLVKYGEPAISVSAVRDLHDPRALRDRARAGAR